jgi:virginiamycin B lyase
MGGSPPAGLEAGIGRITVDGEITEFPAMPGSQPLSLTAGPDGAIWFTEAAGNAITRLDLDGSMTRFPLPHAGSFPWEITVGADGALWFTQLLGNRIGRMTTDGELTEFPLPTPNARPNEIEPGPERGTLVFSQEAAGKIGRITVDGAISEYALHPDSRPLGVTAGDGMDLWIAQRAANSIARLHVVRAMGPAYGCPPPHVPSNPQGVCRAN